MSIAGVANLDTERSLFSDGVQIIAGMDEVGRGSLAGPVGVGVAFVSAGNTLTVEGLTDSKALTEKKRLGMISSIHNWCIAEIGYSQPEEIDALGMTCALRLAGQRALAKASIRSFCRPTVVLLDGKHDWLSKPKPDLCAELDEAELLYHRLCATAWQEQEPWEGSVITVIRGDSTCASIAAASVVAKVDRDCLMTALDTDYPIYGWVKNKGYGSAKHRQALADHGPTPQHRLSWNLGVNVQQLKQAYAQRLEA